MTQETMMTRRYPIGIQTFSEIIRGGYVYVDKTDIFNSPRYRILLTLNPNFDTCSYWSRRLQWTVF